MRFGFGLILFFSTVSAYAQNSHHFQLIAGPGAYPVVSGTTDIPDGTKLFVRIMKPHLPDGARRLSQGLTACDGDCGDLNYKGDPVVNNGAFQVGPLSFGDEPVRPGIYPLRIFIVPKVMTDEAFRQPVYVSEVRIPGAAPPQNSGNDDELAKAQQKLKAELESRAVRKNPSWPTEDPANINPQHADTGHSESESLTHVKRCQTLNQSVPRSGGFPEWTPQKKQQGRQRCSLPN
jgi:hypothetical protein